MSITFKALSHVYNAGSPFAYLALDQISLTIPENKMIAIIGETGSGKTTLVQHLNALLLPSDGELEIAGRMITSKEKPKHLKSLRKDVGLVFQFPEYQLFEETIIKDVCFGPKNFGVPEAEAIELAKQYLTIVGIDESDFERSPFDLSGGQKRRVAIAGILAMDPKILVLDEPTAGLDPQGAQEMMQLFLRLKNEFDKTVLIVTHDMEHVLDYCEEVVVVADGHIKKQCDVQTFFKNVSVLEELHINPPAVIRLREELCQRGFHIPTDVVDMNSLVQIIASEVKHHE